MAPFRFTVAGVSLVCIVRSSGVSASGFPMVRATVLDAVLLSCAQLERVFGTADRATELTRAATLAQTTAWDARAAVDRAVAAARARVLGAA